MAPSALPFLTWPRPKGPQIRADLIAGASVAVVAIPQSLAYAQLAGLPPHLGLYAAFVPTIVAALFGSSAPMRAFGSTSRAPMRSRGGELRTNTTRICSPTNCTTSA
jgi:MFS superfamily sulfate permease-like transporter